MRQFYLKTDLDRPRLGDYQLPLGLVPKDMPPPRVGYTVTFTPGEDDDPDTYAYQIVISHERLADLIHRAFELLPDELFGIVEISSYDAYRAVDTYVAEEPIRKRQFIDIWKHLEPILLEDGAIGAGAQAEEPFIEVFMDQWKAVNIHVPIDTQEDVEQLLSDFRLEEVPQTWPDEEELSRESRLEVRPILDLEEESALDLDELLIMLRQEWNLVLDVDPDRNVDEGGRELGLTLWHAIAILEGLHEPERGAYMSVWATASSLSQMHELIDAELERSDDWVFVDLHSVERVAYDERPDELKDLPARRQESAIHLVSYDDWTDGGDEPPEPEPPGEKQA